MTTTVSISCPKPNHKALEVMVERFTGIDGETAVSHRVTLNEGQHTTVHLHGGNRVVISEVEKTSPIAEMLG